MRFFILFFYLITSPCWAQLYFYSAQDIDVEEDGEILSMPWIGGLNAPQFSEIDLNGDLIKDIMIFDRDDENFIPILFNPYTISDEHAYFHDAQFELDVPTTKYWALARDLNNDGKNDLLTSSNGGINYYKNTTQGNQVSFEFVETLESKRNGNYSTIYVGNADIPAIVDGDLDGDLDVLTFNVPGIYVEFHENVSEDPSEVDFHLTDKCWGDFTENFSDNSVNLSDDVCAGPLRLAMPLHSGSTLAAYDLDGDQDMDLMLGDISFKNIVQLTNSYVDDEALMIEQNTAFPSAHPVDLSVFPALYFVDYNRDGRLDMLASPNASNFAENKTNVWYYKNTGTNQLPNFEFQHERAFQEHSIDEGRFSKVELADYNQDGLMDLFVAGGQRYQVGGLTSTVSYYQNVGTSSTPKFELMTTDFAQLSDYNLGTHLDPVFNDFDDDGDLDMVVGVNNGKLYGFENQSTTSNLWQFTYQPTLFDGLDVGDNATPCFYDANGDNLEDLLVGNRFGRLSYYVNNGTASSPNFVLDTESVGNLGYEDQNDISFIDFQLLEVDGETQMYLGTNQSGLRRISTIDNNIHGTFTVEETDVMSLSNIKNTSPAIADLNNDGYPDMILGNRRGGVLLFFGLDENAVSIPEHKPSIQLYPNPVSSSLNIQSSENWKRYQILNSTGQLIENHIFNSLKIDVSSLPQGVYILKIESDVAVETIRFVKL
ncbi:MAG: T9SS type A sorting domain-containing protein [Flavobacteriales bacterium]